MPKVWLTWNKQFQEYEVWKESPDQEEVIECEMNASLFRQIRAAEAKFEKFQGILEKFYVEGKRHPTQVRRVR